MYQKQSDSPIQSLDNLLHILHLDAIGGVETLFYHFIRSSTHNKHSLLVANQKIHPQFSDSKRFLKQIAYLKYWKGIKIPAFLRSARYRALVNQMQPEKRVFWNYFGDNAAGSQQIYYDHGAAWRAPDTSKTRDFFSKTDRFISCCHASKRVLQLRFGIKKEITVVLNGVRPEMTPEILSTKDPISNRPIRLGMAGRLIPLKGFPLALHAVKLLRNQGVPVTLQIAGVGPEKAHLQQLTKHLGIDSEVRFLGAVKEMRQFYLDSDILICCSLKEALSLVPIEAQTCGSPVVCSATDGLPEAIQEGETGYALAPTLPLSDYSELGGKIEGIPELVYNPSTDQMAPPALVSPESIAQAVCRILQRLPEMGKKAAQFSQEKFSFASYVANLEKALIPRTAPK